MLSMRTRRRRGHPFVFAMALGIAVLSLLAGDLLMLGLMLGVVWLTWR